MELILFYYICVALVQSSYLFGYFRKYCLMLCSTFTVDFCDGAVRCSASQEAEQFFLPGIND